jgi:prepilin-type N-terminal cleavage/methylation domain-containing protein
MNAKGFTLVETLIALVIVAVSLSALVKANQQNAQQIIYFKQKTLVIKLRMVLHGYNVALYFYFQTFYRRRFSQVNA